MKETAWQGEMALLFEGFIGGGLQSGDGVILIATEKHLKALANRVMQKGLISKPPAEQVLEQFMVNGWPVNLQIRLRTRRGVSDGDK